MPRKSSRPPHRNLSGSSPSFVLPLHHATIERVVDAVRRSILTPTPSPGGRGEMYGAEMACQPFPQSLVIAATIAGRTGSCAFARPPSGSTSDCLRPAGQAFPVRHGNLRAKVALRGKSMASRSDRGHHRPRVLPFSDGQTPLPRGAGTVHAINETADKSNRHQKLNRRGAERRKFNIEPSRCQPAKKDHYNLISDKPGSTFFFQCHTVAARRKHKC